MKLLARLDSLLQKPLSSVRFLRVAVIVLFVVSSGLAGMLRVVMQADREVTREALPIADALQYFEAQGCEMTPLRDIPFEKWVDFDGSALTLAHGAIIRLYKNNTGLAGAWRYAHPEEGTWHIIALDKYGIDIIPVDHFYEPPEQGFERPWDLASSDLLNHLSCLVATAQELQEAQALVPYE